MIHANFKKQTQHYREVRIMNCFCDRFSYKSPCRRSKTSRIAISSLFACILIFLAAPALSAQAVLPKIEITPPASFTKGTPNYHMKFHTTSSGMPGSGGSHRMVHLELGAQPGPAGGAAPKAWHMIPPGMHMGEYLPLIAPVQQAAPDYSGRQADPNYKPEKMIIKTYWGCSDTVRPGQPNVLDTSKMTQQNMPDMSAFAPKGGRAYGAAYGGGKVGKNTVLWPNQQDNRSVPASASLIGDHFVHGNLVPQIKCSMDAKHDIMKALNVATQGQSQQDAITVRWHKLPTAIGYHVMAIGANSSGKEMVMWTSSETPNMNVSGQFIDTPQVNKHVSAKVILPADRDSCTIPRGIFAATSPPMIMVTAWGADYWASYPARPANAPKDWKPDWSVKSQFLSTANTMFGMPSGGAGYNAPDNSQDGGAHAPRGRSKSGGEAAPDVVRGILRGIF
jgi:hypothetical protein